jgi:hypothetical protein
MAAFAPHSNRNDLQYVLRIALGYAFLIFGECTVLGRESRSRRVSILDQAISRCTCS